MEKDEVASVGRNSKTTTLFGPLVNADIIQARKRKTLPCIQIKTFFASGLPTQCPVAASPRSTLRCGTPYFQAYNLYSVVVDGTMALLPVSMLKSRTPKVATHWTCSGENRDTTLLKTEYPTCNNKDLAIVCFGLSLCFLARNGPVKIARKATNGIDARAIGRSSRSDNVMLDLCL